MDRLALRCQAWGLGVRGPGGEGTGDPACVISPPAFTSSPVRGLGEAKCPPRSGCCDYLEKSRATNRQNIPEALLMNHSILLLRPLFRNMLTNMDWVGGRTFQKSANGLHLIWGALGDGLSRQVRETRGRGTGCGAWPGGEARMSRGPEARLRAAWAQIPPPVPYHLCDPE